MFLNLKIEKKHIRRFRLFAKSGAGFTLIELIVVMAVFLFIIGAAISIFISIFHQQKRILVEQEILNQISYVEEHMSKALRTAKVASTDSDKDCLGEDNLGYIYLLTHPDQTYRGIKFLNQLDPDSSNNPICQEFFVDVASSTDPRLVLWEKKGTGAPVAITSANLQVDPENPIRFSINGSDDSPVSCPDPCGALNEDLIQPRVTILLNVKITGGNQNDLGYLRTIQTTVSQRNLNVK